MNAGRLVEGFACPCTPCLEGMKAAGDQLTRAMQPNCNVERLFLQKFGVLADISVQTRRAML